MPVKSLNKNIFSVVWSVSNKILDGSPQDFVMSNISLIESMLDSKFIIKSEIVSFPLSSHHLESYMKEGVVVVGDAAHSLHPLAGQGINLGFSDADILCEELISAYEKGYSINSYRVLKSYELRRKSMNEIMLKAMDGFVNLFGSSNIYIRTLRNFGLTFFNKTSFIKAFFINHASGNHKL
jgi:2-octaprenylphenol hydroxylase